MHRATTGVGAWPFLARDGAPILRSSDVHAPTCVKQLTAKSTSTSECAADS